MAGGRPSSARTARIPALDGLRGVAVAAVLLFHAGVSGTGGGFLGVSTFFTLSGFLITSLLLIEWDDAGRIDLRRFWSRRARRLLPAALLTLLGVAAYAALVTTGPDAHRIGADGLSALGYVANWRLLATGQTYAALFQTPSPVQHFWSLAIEEQFYVLFPLLMVAVLPMLRTRRALGVALALLALASAALAWPLWSPGQDPSRLYYGTDTRAVELLVGAVLATRLAGRTRSRDRSRRLRTAVWGIGGLIGLLVLWTTTTQRSDLLYRGGLPLNAVLTCLVISATTVAGPVRSLLAWRPLRGLGLVSYGVYLYHWPIFLWLDADRTGLTGGPLLAMRLTVTLTLAVASYHVLEQPIRAGRRVRRRRPRVVVPAAAVAVAAVLLLAPGLAPEGAVVEFAAVRRSPGDAERTPPRPDPPPGRARSASTVGRPTAPIPLTGPPPEATGPMMIVGDSVALTLGRGLERWGLTNRVPVANAARLWCPIARGGRLAASLGRSVETCGDWATTWPGRLDGLHPRIVLVLTTIWDLSPRQRDEWGPDFLSIGDPRLDAHIVAEWTAAVELLRRSGAEVVWLVPACTPDPVENDALRYARRHYLPAVRASGATTLDLAPLLCPGGTFTNSVDGVDEIRPDGNHFSDPGADLTARWIVAHLGSNIEPPALTPPRRA